MTVASVIAQFYINTCVSLQLLEEKGKMQKEKKASR